MSNYTKNGRGVVDSVQVTCTDDKPTHAILCLPGRGQHHSQIMNGLLNYGEFEKTAFFGLTPMGRAWYPLPISSDNQDDAVSGIPAAVFSIEEEVDDLLKEFDIPYSNLAIIGFSAGAVMALQYLFWTQKELAGVFAHSGAILEPESVPVALNNTPVVLFHNRNDECFAWDERFIPMQQAVIEKGYNVHELIDDGGHAMYVEDMEHIELFLKQRGFSTSRTECDDRQIVSSKLFAETSTSVS